MRKLREISVVLMLATASFDADAAVGSPEAACLYTPAEVAALVGARAVTARPAEVRAGKKHIGWWCYYSAGAGRNDLLVLVSSADSARFENERKLAEHLAQPHQYRLLTDVGDAAFVGQGESFSVWSKDRMLTVQHVALAAGKSVSDDSLRAFARIGVARMAQAVIVDKPQARADVAWPTSTKKEVALRLTERRTGKVLASVAVEVESDNGIRCVKAPCPTNMLTWKGSTDASGKLAIPPEVVQQSMAIRRAGTEDWVNLVEARNTGNNEWLISLEP